MALSVIDKAMYVIKELIMKVTAHSSFPLHHRKQNGQVQTFQEKSCLCLS